MKIRCSSLGDFMTQNVKRDDIGETAKTVIIKQYAYDHYRYEEILMTPEIEKGLRHESEAITLVQDVFKGELRIKNKKNYSNDWATGTPDLVLTDVIEDIKCSSNLLTFLKASPTKAYDWQGWGYMWLTGRTKFLLRYCLVPDHEDEILEQEKRYYFKFGCDDSNQDYIDICEKIRHNNNIINSIPKKDRIKTFEFDFDQKRIDEFKRQYDLGLKFYNSLKGE